MINKKTTIYEGIKNLNNKNYLCIHSFEDIGDGNVYYLFGTFDIEEQENPIEIERHSFVFPQLKEKMTEKDMFKVIKSFEQKMLKNMKN